jgi:hypothetical protein
MAPTTDRGIFATPQKPEQQIHYAKKHHGEAERIPKMTEEERPKIDNKVNPNVIECPCQTFGSIRDVQVALDDEDRTRTDTLIHWLSGGVDEAAFREKRSLSCGVAVAGNGTRTLRCKVRVRTSLSILNAIRDACRPFLESHVNNVHANVNVSGGSGGVSGSGASGGKKDKDETPAVYEEAFPSLGSMTSATTTTTTHTFATATTSPMKANVLVGRKKVKPKSNAATASVPVAVKQQQVITPVKQKRRIRPASINPVAPSAWGQSAASTSSSGGNLVNLPSEEPLSLNDRVRGPQLVSQASSESEAHDKQVVDADERVTNKAAVVSVNTANFSTPRKKPAPLVRETKDEIVSLPQLQNLIDTYCTLIRSSLVPSTALELHLLIRLLTLTPHDTDTSSGESELSEILCSTSRCLYFSCQVLRNLAYILRGIGMPLLPELVRCRPFYSQLPELAQEFELFMEEQAARGLSTSALPVGNQTALLTLPFNQQRD